MKEEVLQALEAANRPTNRGTNLPRRKNVTELSNDCFIATLFLPEDR